MDARISPQDTVLLHQLSPATAAREADQVRLAAISARDEVIGNAVRAAFGKLFGGIGAVLRFVAQYPERARVLRQLHGLSDRELADIGLERGDLGRVFDEDFAANHRITGARKAPVPAGRAATA
jgi:uncharacterized protein YjiS (DUF1127 family)